MDIQFGRQVLKNLEELIASGKDVNQSAKILFDQDPQGHNYGIGIILDGQGQPAKSSATMAEYAAAELQNCDAGVYMNSARHMQQIKEAVLRWQRVPETYWDDFQLALPSDAGTGAVKTAVEYELLLQPDITRIGIEELGWPAHKAIAKLARVGVEEISQDGVCSADLLPLYQAGPMNTTGLVRDAAIIRARAEAAAKNGQHVILDRAYSGFEFARLVDQESYDTIMRQSFELQLAPFLQAGVPTSIAVSPTKAFVTFAFRPCGLLLVYSPNKEDEKIRTTALNAAIRARGSSFEHPITRAFVKALVNDLPRLEVEQAAAFKRLAAAEKLWAKLVQGTPIEYLFSEKYAGLFRNPRTKKEAPEYIYGSHLYPVFSQGRCRLNATGLPEDESLAARHVQVFADYCLPD